VKIIKPVDTVYRVARAPWAIRAPSQLHRFDINDPTSPIYTVYVGESETAAFAEVLAPLRPDLGLVAKLEAMPCDPGSPLPAVGMVSAHWRGNRKIGVADTRAGASAVDLTSAETIAHLRRVPDLAEQVRACGFPDLDESALKAGGERGRDFTQAVAAWVYNQGFSALRYGSRLGAEFHCIAGFIPVASRDVTESELIAVLHADLRISADHPALAEVARTFGLSVERN
jgi:RES domain